MPVSPQNAFLFLIFHKKGDPIIYHYPFYFFRKYFTKKSKKDSQKRGIILPFIEYLKEYILRIRLGDAYLLLKFLTHTKKLSDIFIFAKVR